MLKTDAQLFAHPAQPRTYLNLEPGQWVQIRFSERVCNANTKYKDLCNGFNKDDAALLTASFTTTYKDCETDGKYKEQELKSKPRRVRVINLGGHEYKLTCLPSPI